jgi:hypothetical protein
MTPLVRIALALALLVASRPATAITIDGVLDPAYGAAISTQSLQTHAGGGQIGGNSTTGDLNFSNGSELDQVFATVEDDVLYLFLTGNLALMLNANQNGTVRHVLDVFVDAAPGGQQDLNGLGAGFVLNGLRFDDGFEADYWFELEGDGNGFFGPREWTARYGTLATPSGGTTTTLGISTAGGPGVLTGGTNPHGILVTIDNRNTVGVDAGCSAGSGDGAMRGIEWAIPLSALGNAEGCLEIAAFVRTSTIVTNQTLAPLPSGTCAIGTISDVDFSLYAGDQYVEFCPVTSVPAGIAGPPIALLGSNPVRDGAVRVACVLPDARPGRLALVDAAGRIVRGVRVGGAAGRHVAELGTAAGLAAGVYWVRLTHGGIERSTRISILH